MHLKPTQLDGWILYTSSSQLRADQAPSTPEGSRYEQYIEINSLIMIAEGLFQVTTNPYPPELSHTLENRDMIECTCLHAMSHAKTRCLGHIRAT